ncbi:hypothetical protein [Nostoc sp. DSM 114159]
MANSSEVACPKYRQLMIFLLQYLFILLIIGNAKPTGIEKFLIQDYQKQLFKCNNGNKNVNIFISSLAAAEKLCEGYKVTRDAKGHIPRN